MAFHSDNGPVATGRRVATDETLAQPQTIPADVVLSALEVDSFRGLSAAEAAARLARDGPNALATAEGRSVGEILLKQVSSVVIWLLIAAAIAALMTDSQAEAIAIVIVLVINALTGFVIEWQADRSLQALRKGTRTITRAMRDGSVQTVDSSEIVQGDVLVLSSGDRVPADARLVETAGLSVNESTLTGESLAVDKSAEPVRESTPIAEQKSMLFLGTTVVTGRAVAVVTSIGERTELGKIGKMLEHAQERKTPLELRLADLGRRLVFIVLAIGAVVLFFGLLRGEPLWLMVQVSISLAVAAVPEGLPAVTTLILALGLLRMARQSAIVRHLAAVETLGSTTVICTDKTGTLTENRLSVQEMFLSDGRTVRVSDLVNGRPSDDELLKGLGRVGILCNEAAFHSVGTASAADPTEAALITVAGQIGLEIESERLGLTVVKELPFTSAAKKMIVVFQNSSGGQFAMLKGAPSVVLDACRSFVDSEGRLAALNDKERRKFQTVNETMANRALRVLAFAEKPMAGDNDDDLEHGYTFIGFMAMADPPRYGAAHAIREAKAAGIRVVMLTGDQIATAEAIAKQIGLAENNKVVTVHSHELDNADDERIAKLARSAHVFARATPEDKFRLVKALQQDGEVVAVTGDGVNDAPALKQADIGIAFGERGTDVAKEAADVVLTNDDFSVIVKAIEGGRTIYANIVKFVHLMFSHNLGEIFVIFGAIIAGLPLPLLPLQILWINLVTDVFPALALALEPSAPETMRQKPRPPSDAMLSTRFMFLVAWQGAMLAIVSLAVYVWALRNYGDSDHARTVSLFALVAVQLGHLFNCRSRTRSVFSHFFTNPFIFAAAAVVMALQLSALYFPPFVRVLRTEPLNQQDWIAILAAFVLPIVVVEITKLFSTPRSPSAVGKPSEARSHH